MAAKWPLRWARRGERRGSWRGACSGVRCSTRARGARAKTRSEGAMIRRLTVENRACYRARAGAPVAAGLPSAHVIGCSSFAGAGRSASPVARGRSRRVTTGSSRSVRLWGARVTRRERKSSRSSRDAESRSEGVQQYWKSMAGPATIGLEFCLSVLVGLFGGRWLDSRLGTSHWLTFIGLGFGIAAGYRAIYRATVAANRAAEREAEKERSERDRYHGKNDHD